MIREFTAFIFCMWITFFQVVLNGLHSVQKDWQPNGFDISATMLDREANSNLDLNLVTWSGHHFLLI